MYLFACRRDVGCLRLSREKSLVVGDLRSDRDHKQDEVGWSERES